MQQGPKPNELVSSQQEGAGSVGSVKRMGGANEGGGGVDGVGVGGNGKLRSGWRDQGADHGREWCGDGEAVGYKGMADISFRRGGDAN